MIRMAPLHLATQRGHIDFVLMLIEHNADVNVQNAYGATPLDMAKSAERTKVVDLLEKK